MNNYKIASFLFALFSLLMVSCEPLADDIGEDDVLIKDDCFIIIPDLQNYMDKEALFKYPESIAAFCNRADYRNHIKACFQVGDLTNNNQYWQYENARKHFFSLFHKDNYPIFCLGNHDYGENGNSYQRSTNLPNDFLPLRESFIDVDYPENYLCHVTINNKVFAVLVLEFATRNDTLEWANTIINSEKSIPFIILTHAFLNNEGQIFDYKDTSCDQTYSPKIYNMGGLYKNDGMEVFNKIVYHNPNVKFVICGHCLSPNYIEYLPVKNAQGDSVHCIMVDYQHYSYGGAGFVGCLFNSGDNWCLRSVSTTENCFGKIKFEFEL